MASSALKGKRYINLLRVSTTMNEASVEDMKKANDKFAADHGMVWVRDVVLEGVSGSKTFNRRDLKQLLAERKFMKNYDVIVVYDSSRLTRGGARHGSNIRSDFAKVGVLIISVMDPVPDGDFKDVMQSIIDTQNNLYAKKLSGFVTRGIVDGLRRGDVEHHGGLPIGIDRVYVRADGKPFLRLRYVGNGERHLIDEVTGEIVRRLLPKIDRNTAYKKQACEKVWLVPGDERVVAAIREAFTLRYVHNWGFIRISRHLTRNGIIPLGGIVWSASSVRSFLMNPMYLGWSYSLKVACGLYHTGDVDRPRVRVIDQDKLEAEERSQIPYENRPRSEMLKIEHPKLKDFITDPRARENAEKAINQFFDEHHVKKVLSIKNNNRHPMSRFFLKGLIRDSRFDKPLYGFRSGANNRYYKLANAGEYAEPGTGSQRWVPAVPLEQAVIIAVKTFFANTASMVQMVRAHVQRQLTEQPEHVDRAKLEGEVNDIKGRLTAIFATARGSEFAGLKDVIEQLRLRRDAIEHELSLKPVREMANDGAEIAAKIVAKLSEFENELDDGCYEKLRILVRAICRNFVIDLKTFETTFEVTLPEMALRTDPAHFDDVVLTCTGVNSRASQNHAFSSISLARCVLKPQMVIRPNLVRQLVAYESDVNLTDLGRAA